MRRGVNRGIVMVKSRGTRDGEGIPEIVWGVFVCYEENCYGAIVVGGVYAV